MRDPDEDSWDSWSNRRYVDASVVEISATLNVWIDGIKWSAKLSNERVIEERSHIYSWVIRQGTYYDLKSIDWDGKTAYINYGNINEYLGDREDLMFMIEELESIPISDLDLIQKFS
jgi:hypothetical protein